MADEVVLLIQGCKAGIEESWNAFHKDFARMAMNILNSKFPNLSSDDKDDVVQNVFVKLHKGGLENFHGDLKYEFLAYFKTIVINTAKSHYSYIARKKEEPFEDTMPTPENPHDETETIQKILKEFPMEDRQIVLLKSAGHKDKEVAEMLRIPMGTVASKYSRIKEKLRKLLHE